MLDNSVEDKLHSRSARPWPPPWWTVVSALVLAGIVAALGRIIATPAHPSDASGLPTPILITVTSAGGQPAATADATAVASGQFKAGDMVRVARTGGFDLRLRSGPGTLYETLKLVAEGARLEILGEPRQADEYVWWPVRDPSDGTQGWVVADYLEISTP